MFFLDAEIDQFIIRVRSLHACIIRKNKSSIHPGLKFASTSDKCLRKIKSSLLTAG
jgi:hypothetical protein